MHSIGPVHAPLSRRYYMTEVVFGFCFLDCHGTPQGDSRLRFGVSYFGDATRYQSFGLRRSGIEGVVVHLSDL